MTRVARSTTSDGTSGIADRLRIARNAAARAVTPVPLAPPWPDAFFRYDDFWQ
jgi:hypothetical protein